MYNNKINFYFFKKLIFHIRIAVGSHFFDGCKQLKSITIPKSVTKIGYSAFWGCSGLTITFNGTMAEWKAIDKESKWKYASSKFTIHCTDGDLKE